MDNDKYRRARLYAELSIYLWIFIGPLNLVFVYLSRTIDKSLQAVTNEDIESHKQIIKHTRIAIAINITVLVAGAIIGIAAALLLGPLANQSSNI